MRLDVAQHGLHKLGLKSKYWGNLVSLFNTGLHNEIKVQGVCQQHGLREGLIKPNQTHGVNQSASFKELLAASAYSELVQVYFIEIRAKNSNYGFPWWKRCVFPFPDYGCLLEPRGHSWNALWGKKNATAQECRNFRVGMSKRAVLLATVLTVMSRLRPFKEIVNTTCCCVTDQRKGSPSTQICTQAWSLASFSAARSVRVSLMVPSHRLWFCAVPAPQRWSRGRTGSWRSRPAPSLHVKTQRHCLLIPILKLRSHVVFSRSK